jgi:hypothetical protein
VVGEDLVVGAHAGKPFRAHRLSDRFPVDGDADVRGGVVDVFGGFEDAAVALELDACGISWTSTMCIVGFKDVLDGSTMWNCCERLARSVLISVMLSTSNSTLSRGSTPTR